MKLPKFILPALMLFGATVGVGIFGVPAVLAAVGPWWALALAVVVGGTQLLLQLFYAETAIATPEKARLGLLAKHWLGGHWHLLASIGNIGLLWGAMIAYILVGGKFVQTISTWALGIEGGQVSSWQLGWGVIGSLAVALGLRRLVKISAVATTTLVIVATGAIAVAASRFAPHLIFSASSGGFVDITLAYGVLFFALSGLPAILEMEDVIPGDARSLRRAVIVGALAAWAITIAFGFTVWGAFGKSNLSDLPAAFGAFFDPWAMALVAAFGVLGMMTAYFACATNLRETLSIDLGFDRVTSWALATLVPILVALTGTGDFVQVISWAGAVFGGGIAVVVVAIYIAVQQKGESHLKLPVWLSWSVLVLVVVGGLAGIARIIIEG